jgi:hypothetical protein
MMTPGANSGRSKFWKMRDASGDAAASSFRRGLFVRCKRLAKPLTTGCVRGSFVIRVRSILVVGVLNTPINYGR